MDKWIQLLIDVTEISIIIVIMIHLLPILLMSPGWTILVVLLIALITKKKK